MENYENQLEFVNIQVLFQNYRWETGLIRVVNSLSIPFTGDNFLIILISILETILLCNCQLFIYVSLE